eukprot:Skav203361  [mRNA]  locus=scaffold18:90693:92977:- [translate_table: standard]
MKTYDYERLYNGAESEQNSDESWESGGNDEDYVLELSQDLAEDMQKAAYLRALSRVIESAEKLQSLREDKKNSKVYKRHEEKEKLLEEHRRLHQILRDEHKDIAQVEDFADVNEEHLKELDELCEKKWKEEVNALDVENFAKIIRNLQGQSNRESLISFLESLTVRVDINGLRRRFHLKRGGAWRLQPVEAPASTLECCGGQYVSFNCGYGISPATMLLMSSDTELSVLLRELTDLGIDSGVFSTVFACSLVSAAEMRVRHKFKLVIFKDALFVVLLAYVGYHVRNDFLPGTLAVLLMFGLTLLDFLRALLRAIFYIWAKCNYGLKIAKASTYTFTLLIVETFSVIFILSYVGSIVHTEWTKHGDQFNSLNQFWRRRTEVWFGSDEKDGGGFFGDHPNLVALLVLCRWAMFIMNLQLIDVIGRNVVPLAHAVTRPASLVFLFFLFCSLLATFHAYFVFPLERATDLNEMLEDFIDMFRLEMLSDFDLAELQHMRENITGRVKGGHFVGGISLGGNRQYHQGIRIGFVVISLSISVVAMNTYIGLLGELYCDAVKRKNEIYNHYLATVMWPHLFTRPLLLCMCGRDYSRCEARSRKSSFDIEEAEEPEDTQLCWMFYDKGQRFDVKSD